MMKPFLKFCMVTTFYPPYNFGGDGICVFRLSNELARLGHRVDVIHCEDSYRLFNKSDITGKYLNHPNIKVYRLKSRFGWLSPFLTQQTGFPFFKSRQLRKILENNQYDVIHYHNMSLIGIATVRYGSAVKLYTMHEHWLVCPNHVLWKFKREVCQKKSCLACVLFEKRPPQLWRYTGVFNRFLPMVDQFISPSRFTKSKHLALGLNIPITHIPHFLQKKDKMETRLQNTDFTEDHSSQPYFLFVGRLEKIKGVQNLIQVFNKQSEYTLLVAGDGTYLATLTQLAGDNANIKFLGRLPHGKLEALYQNCIAVIVPSICYEVFGIIIIEAFQMKAPVIVNNLGSLPELVSDSNGGFVYNNEKELVAAMQKMASDPDLRSELGYNGHKAYLQYWSAESHMKKYFALIETLRREHRA